MLLLLLFICWLTGASISLVRVKIKEHKERYSILSCPCLLVFCNLLLVGGTSRHHDSKDGCTLTILFCSSSFLLPPSPSSSSEIIVLF